MRKFKDKLQVLSCGCDTELYENYVSQTKRLYLSLYPQYTLSVTAQKLLDHRRNIIKHHMDILHISQLSEEAQETRKKM